MERLRRKNTSQDESPRKKRKEDRCFQINEKILCYEPDAKLERVLYDAKIRDVHEILKRGKKCYEYLVHFQGWNSSWDRRVNEDFILKDTPENRKLQRDLAEKNQLQLGAYLYRKERKKRKRLNEINERKLLLCATEGTEAVKQEDQNDIENEYYSSSATESHDDDRVFLHMGEVLKKHLEYDNLKVTRDKNFAVLPAKLPILVILENFVKSYAIKVVTAPQEMSKPKRRSSILGIKKEPKVKAIDYDSISSNIDLCKEVADGLRVYFNFILKDFLLYAEEKEEYDRIMSDENLKDFRYDPGVYLNLDNFFSKPEPLTESQQQQQQQLQDIPENQTPSIASDKRMSSRLRSHSLKTDDEEKLENLSSMASTSSNDSIAIHELHPKGIFSKQWKPLNSGITPAAYKIIEEVFNWRMVGDDSSPEASMIYGIYHLSRLVVKLPEFLSATPMNEEKISQLLKYLDAFVEFLEENNEIYGPENFVDVKEEEVFEVSAK